MTTISAFSTVIVATGDAAATTVVASPPVEVVAAFGDRGRPRAPSGPSAGARVHDLLCRRAGLAAGHPGRVALRVDAIEAALPLARCLAVRYAGRGEPLDDLVQVAALALVKAVDGYDPARQVAFTSYAVPTIVGALKHHFRDATWRIRVPRGVQELANAIVPATTRLAHQLGRSPTPGELAGYLQTSEHDLALARRARWAHDPDSLDASLVTGGSGRLTLIDALGVVDARLDTVLDRRILYPLLAALPAGQRRILVMRYFGDMTQAQIAARIGVSQMQISRLLIRALAQLRAGMPVEPAPSCPPTWLRG